MEKAIAVLTEYLDRERSEKIKFEGFRDKAIADKEEYEEKLKELNKSIKEYETAIEKIK